MVDFIRLTMPDMTPIVVPTKDIACITPRITTGSYVQCYQQDNFSVLETPTEIGEMLGAACVAPTAAMEKPVSLPITPRDDGAVKGEDEAWSAWESQSGLAPLAKQSARFRMDFRKALHIAIAANQQPMHFTIDDVVHIANASNKTVVAYLRSMGATVEYP